MATAFIFYRYTAVCCDLSAAQEFSYPVISNRGQSAADFVPAGWAISDSACGDLNKDGLQDFAIVLQQRDGVTVLNSYGDTVVTRPRILLIVFKEATANYFRLLEQSNTFILNHDNPVMDDPYVGVTIEKGILKLEFHLFYSMGSWHTSTSNYKFRYTGQEFSLIGAEIFSIHRATLDYTGYSYNFLTGRRSCSRGNEGKGTKKTSWKRMVVAPLKTFKSFTYPWSWEIEPGIFL